MYFQNKAKKCLTEAATNLSPESLAEINEFKEKISESVYSECDLLKDTFAKLNDITNEYKEFVRLEAETRLIVN